MNMIAIPAVASMVLLLTTITLVSSCSGSREDVRVTLCKDLTSEMLDSPQALAWKGNENRFQRPAYVEVKVLFELPEMAAGEAVCFYGYDTPEENAMTQSQPLSAYSALPYEMVLNGEPVAHSVLSDAIKLQQRHLGRKILDAIMK